MTETPNFQLLTDMGYTSVNSLLPEMDARYTVRTNLGVITKSVFREGVWEYDQMQTEQSWLSGVGSPIPADFVTHWKQPIARGMDALTTADENLPTE